MVLTITTAVAAGNLLVRLEAVLPSAATRTLISEVEAIERSVSFATRGNPSRAAREILELRRAAPQRAGRTLASLQRPASQGAPAANAGSEPAARARFATCVGTDAEVGDRVQIESWLAGNGPPPRR